MQREQILDHALNVLEQNGLASTSSLKILAEEMRLSEQQLEQFWADRDALLYDALQFHAQQIDSWRQEVLQNSALRPEQKLMARYEGLNEHVTKGRFPGCLFIAACSFFPETDHPIHQLAEQQKLTSLELTRELLRDMDADDADMVAQQMELIQEGCLSKLLVKRQLQDVSVAKRLAEDILQVAQCRRNGALS